MNDVFWLYTPHRAVVSLADEDTQPLIGVAVIFPDIDFEGLGSGKYGWRLMDRVLQKHIDIVKKHCKMTI